ncbi:MAG: sugar nucleotide-binding protein [Chthoniobacterales bacterium]
MNKVIITGMNGTVAPVLANELRGRGCEVVAWDRGAVSPDDGEAVARFIREVKPSAIVHCAMGSAQGAEDMARVCAEEGSKFLYVSSASVYGTQQQGPFTIHDAPEPCDDYGRYKLECEQRVRAVNDQAIVVRIGWQIALRRGGNNMVEHLAQKQAEHGHITASTEWFPACSFLDDTAKALAGALETSAPGLYLLDGNPGWSFWQMAVALNRALDAGWQVRESGDFRWNNQLLDRRLGMFSVVDYLARPKATEK